MNRDFILAKLDKVESKLKDLQPKFENSRIAFSQVSGEIAFLNYTRMGLQNLLKEVDQLEEQEKQKNELKSLPPLEDVKPQETNNTNVEAQNLNL
jgi:hypothetical protein